jgi:hypothetical protein
LVAGAQINKVPKVNPNVVPRLGFVYQVSPNLGVKLMHAQAYRAAFGSQHPIKERARNNFPFLIPSSLHLQTIFNHKSSE